MSLDDIPLPDWDDMSLYEQLAIMPEETSDPIVKSMLARGMDLTGPEMMLRPAQSEIVYDEDTWINIFSAGRGAGKALDVATPIPTPSGWSRMGSLSVGDDVYDETGSPTKVVAIYDQGRVPGWDLAFSDGTHITACDNHLWVTTTDVCTAHVDVGHGWAASGAITTAEMVRTLRNEDGSLRHYIPTTLPLKTSLAPPYKFAPGELGERVGAEAMQSGGLELPWHVLRTDETSRTAALCGLVATGGTSTHEQAGFVTSRGFLAQRVAELARTLGYAPWVQKSRSVSGGTWYLVRWATSDGPCECGARCRALVSATRVEGVQMRCITVDSPTSLYLAGEGMVPTHNTFTGACWVNERAAQNPGSRIILLGRTVADVRDVMVGGDSGIVAKAPRDFVPEYIPSKRLLEWPNGTTATTFSADAPSQLRGPQGHYAWCDELAAFPVTPDSSGATAWDNCIFATRLGDMPQILVTTTPKRTSVIRELYRMVESNPRVKMHQTSTLANRTNLSAEYIQAVFDRYAGTHLEQQELYGELIGDAPGALWRSSDIVIAAVPNDTSMITVIGVDPAVEAGGDNTGIILAKGTREREMSKRRAWVLEDHTMTGSPDEWAAAVHKLWLANPESVVVVEGNQGGQLLRMVLHQLDPNMPVAIVKAIKSKSARAEPVVMAYRQKRIQHVERFPVLEEEMTGWEPGASRWSPGSVDALVWAMTVLLVKEDPLWPYLPAKAAPRGDLSVPSFVSPHRSGWRQPGGLSTPEWRR